jgi:hypothetical protein
MRRTRWIRGLLAMTAIASGQAMAQEEWNWTLTPYLWGAAIDGDVAIGPIAREVDMDFSEIVDVLAGAALFRVEGGNDDHGLMADLVWMRLEPEDEIATLGGVTEAEFDSTILEIGYLRKLDRVDLELGVRYWDFELELDPALLAAVKRDDSWVDGYIGVRFIREIGTNWLWQTRLNLGAGGSDSAFGAELHFAREVGGDNKLVFGFKALGIDYEEESVGGTPFVIDTMFLGGTIGFMFD